MLDNYMGVGTLKPLRGHTLQNISRLVQKGRSLNLTGFNDFLKTDVKPNYWGARASGAPMVPTPMH